jgi:hypothetical protein
MVTFFNCSEKTTSAEVLKLLLGVILVAAALKAFWRHS